MAKASPIQTNFTAGELSPRLEGRTDIAKYDNGVKTLENFVIHPQGGAARRPGTEFVSETADSSQTSRLVPFEFNVDQAYAVELGNETARFYTDGGTLVDEERTAYDSDNFPGIGWGSSDSTDEHFHSFFNDAGTRVYMVKTTETLVSAGNYSLRYDIRQYPLTVPFDITSAGELECEKYFTFRQ